MRRFGFFWAVSRLAIGLWWGCKQESAGQTIMTLHWLIERLNMETTDSNSLPNKMRTCDYAVTCFTNKIRIDGRLTLRAKATR
jgi:hypothetical protein